MATLFIEEYRQLAEDGNGRALQAPGPLIADQQVTISGTSAQSSALKGRYVSIVSDVDCYYNVGANPTAAATAGVGNRYLPLYVYRDIYVEQGDKIAVIEKV